MKKLLLIAKIILAIIVLVALIIIGGMFWLSSDSGREYTHNFIRNKISQNVGYKADVKDIAFSFPMSANLSKISLSDSKGVWLEANNVSINILPTPTLYKHLIITSLNSDSLNILRTPEASEVAMKDSQEPDSSSGGSMDVSLRQIKIKKLSLGQELTGLKEAFEAELKASIKWGGENELLSVDATANISTGVPQLEKGEVKLTANYNLKDDIVTIDSAKFTNSKLALSTKALLNITQETIEASATTEISDISQWQPEFKGKIAGDATLSGKFMQPDFLVNINADSLHYENKPLPSLKAKIVGSGKENGWAGNINIDGEKDIKIETLFLFFGNELKLQKLQSNVGENKANGNLTINTASGLSSGKIVAVIKNLESLAEYMPLELKGQVGATTILSVANDKQKADINIELKNFVSPYGQVADATLNSSFSDVMSQRPDSLKLLLSNGVYNDIKIDKAVFSVVPKNSGWQGDLTASGKAKENFSITTSALLKQIDDKGWQVDIANIKGQYAKLAVLSKSVKVIFFDNILDIKAPEIAINKGNASLAVYLSDNNINASFTGKNLAVSEIKTDIPEEFKLAQANINLIIKGDVERPEINADVSVENIQVSSYTSSVSMNTHATLSDGKLQVESKITDGKAATSDIAVNIPMQLSIKPFAFELNDNAALSGKAKLALDIGLFSKLFLPSGHVLKGKIDGNIKLGGTYGDPSIVGNIKLAGGDYEYIDLGVKLKKISANLIANNNSFNMQDFHAEDGEGNSLIGKATINFTSIKDINYQAEFNGNNLEIFHHPNLKGALSQHIEISGDENSGKIKGNVKSEGIQIYLPDHFISDVAELNIVEAPTKKDAKLENFPDKEKYLLVLNVVLEADNKVFIRGMGVDTELQGKLALTGTTVNPEIKGKLSTIRGRYEEFGKQFKITKGELLFEGDMPPSPFLNLIATIKSGDFEIRPVISGSVLDPKIKMESTPSLPEDEILSVLLFGKDSKKISPLQAVQLANSIRKLSGNGGGGGFDPIGKIRDIVGLDDISVNNNGENAADVSVGVGKHISDNVYVEVERGVDTTSSKASVNIELTPSISVESSAGATGDTSVGVNWKYDY